MSEFLFPIDYAENYLRETYPELERDGGSIRWAAGNGLTELKVEHIDQKTTDGRNIQEIVTLSHRTLGLQGFDVASAASLNRWATLSSFVPGTFDTPAMLCSKVGVFETDREAAERIYAPLICLEACIIHWHAIRLEKGEYQTDPDCSPLQMVNQAPPYQQGDFESVKSSVDQGRGFFWNLGELYYCVEFPWDFGAISNCFSTPEVQESLRKSGLLDDEKLKPAGGRTSLLQVQIADHPIYGKGVLSRLEIPFGFEAETAKSLVDELNRWELAGKDLPPLFGSWCLGERAVTFTTFVPTQMCVPGMLFNLVSWGIVRHFAVHDWLELSTQTRQ